MNEEKVVEEQQPVAVAEKPKKYRKPAMGKKKVCAFCVDKQNIIDYKDGNKLIWKYTEQEHRMIFPFRKLERKSSTHRSM